MEKMADLISFQEFCDYLGIKPTLGNKIIANPKCRFVLRVGGKVYIHKAVLDKEIERCVKNKKNLLED